MGSEMCIRDSPYTNYACIHVCFLFSKKITLESIIGTFVSSLVKRMSLNGLDFIYHLLLTGIPGILGQKIYIFKETSLSLDIRSYVFKKFFIGYARENQVHMKNLPVTNALYLCMYHEF